MQALNKCNPIQPLDQSETLGENFQTLLLGQIWSGFHFYYYIMVQNYRSTFI